jgi:hypothetical protein
MIVNQLCSLHFEGIKTAEQANNNAVTLIAFFNSRARGNYIIFHTSCSRVLYNSSPP